MNINDKEILLDCDILIHFFKADSIQLLVELYGKRLIILQEILDEMPLFKQEASGLVYLFKWVRLYKIPDNVKTKVIVEYAKIRQQYPAAGMGESLCMAVAKFDEKIVASSNLRDTKPYCVANNIEYRTTMDVLHEAFLLKKISEADCDYFIYNVVSKGSIMPYSTISEFIRKSKK